LESLAISGLEELERQVSGLRPPQLDDLGLLAALRWSANEVSQHYGVPIEVIGNGNRLELPPDVRVVLFRISQEAVTNAVRHAEPGKITVKLDITESEVDLMVEDDGSGFDVESTLDQAAIGRCWGILGMIERAALVGGTCEINSQSGEGTVVQVNVPLEGGGAYG
jgi:two-component system sensor histidine kinase UhpB